MNRTFASWIAANPGAAVFLTGLLGLLPLFGLGFAFFLPGAVPALVVLARGAARRRAGRGWGEPAARAGDVGARPADRRSA